jgi:two-component system phosphate regulon sensor histidine kinase PhoR
MVRPAYRLLMAFALAACICAGACAGTMYLNGKAAPLTIVLWCAIPAAAVLTLAGFFYIKSQWSDTLRRLANQPPTIDDPAWPGQILRSGPGEIRLFLNQFNRVVEKTRRQIAILQRQRAELYTLVDAVPDPILAADPRNRLILMNAPAARLLELSAEQAIGQKVVSVITDEQVVELFEAAATANHESKSEPIHREVRLSRGGQKITCQAVAARTAEGGTLVVLRDVSTLARAMQMKTDFVANASHELRTPITAIKIAFETLGDALTDDPEQAQRCMSVIDGHLKRLEEMLRDLLDLSRVESPDHEASPTTVKSAELLSAVRNTMLPLARQKPVELVFEDPEPQQFFSDGRLLNLVLKNLVENGIKYTPAGGTVTVSLTNTGGHSDGESTTTSSVTLTVADTGIGIATEHIDRVFERFYQVDAARSGSAGRGTGLGLAIVKHAVHAVGGSVKLESTVGMGTTVTCVFPQPVTPVVLQAGAGQAD